MTTSPRAHRARILTTTALVAVLAAGLSGVPADADDLVAAETPAITVATDSARQPASTAARAVAGFPRGIVVLNTHGQQVKVFAKGEQIRRQQRLGVASTTFTGLTAGRSYTVVVGGRSLGAVVALDRPGPASSLSVRTTEAPDSVLLAWRQRPTAATGGTRIAFDVTATSAGRPTLRTSVVGRHSTALRGLDPKALYAFTVTPRNSAGAGRPSRAVMTRSLAQIRGQQEAQAEPPKAAPVPTLTVSEPTTPGPPPAPAPPPAPVTKTIYVCPEGFTESPAGACEKKLPYTFTSRTYTFHQEATGPAPLLASYETKVRACPSEYNFEDYGWIMFCRAYGPVPTKTVKDPTPSGFTDNGTKWIRQDPTPAGYTDNGTEWVKTVAKVARVVPA
jgi:hypothetical protein